MIGMSDFRKGMCILIDGKLLKIVEFQHVKPGKGSAFVRTKLKDLDTGAVTDRTFRENEKVEDVYLEKKELQFLYKDGEGYHFMDQANYEQSVLSKDDVGDSGNYIKENDIVSIVFHGTKPIDIDLPTSVTLKVVETEPGFKGDTVSNVKKPAKLETDYIIQVPLFIKEGEMIKVDTRTGEYISRF